MRPLLCLVAAVLLIARSAHADDREEARKAEDWQTAIEHYLHAYELVPHHFAIYNIARDYERLGQLREASTWYQRYIEAAPPSPDRDKVQKLIVEIKLRPAKLTVKSTPSGARVLIDGQKAGVTPFIAPIRGGGHRVAVELDGQRDERDITLEFGEPETVELELHGVRTPTTTTSAVGPAGGAQGVLIVRGQPLGALVTIDDMPAGTLPMSEPIAAGEHNIKVTSYGYSNYETTATVPRGSDTALDVNLSRALGSIEPPRQVQVGYMIGFGGGADLRGQGAVVLGEFGVRIGQADLTSRIGKAVGLTAVDFVIRWAFLKTRVSPYLGGGYSYTAARSESGSGSGSTTASGGSGWEAVGGLRFDLTKGVGTTFSVIAETGIRSYSGTTSAGATDSGVFIPFTATLQITFGHPR